MVVWSWGNHICLCLLCIQVVLPTFILEKRSLLEMYANFMAHPDLFLSIAAGATPEERIICFVEYYLTAFHEGRKGAVAKKPYNPIIGETFHCSWDVPKDKVKAFRTNGASTVSKDPTKEFGQDQSTCYKLRFVAEQVSHHPPVSCFYCECKEKKMCVNAHVWTKSKFMGMSIGVSMVGEGKKCAFILFWANVVGVNATEIQIFSCLLSLWPSDLSFEPCGYLLLWSLELKL